MSKYTIEESTLTAIADAVRSKDGTVDPIKVDTLANRITSLPSGGGGASVNGVKLKATVKGNAVKQGDFVYVGHQGVTGDKTLAPIAEGTLPIPYNNGNLGTIKKCNNFFIIALNETFSVLKKDSITNEFQFLYSKTLTESWASIADIAVDEERNLLIIAENGEYTTGWSNKQNAYIQVWKLEESGATRIQKLDVGEVGDRWSFDYIRKADNYYYILPKGLFKLNKNNQLEQINESIFYKRDKPWFMIAKNIVVRDNGVGNGLKFDIHDPVFNSQQTPWSKDDEPYHDRSGHPQRLFTFEYGKDIFIDSNYMTYYNYQETPTFRKQIRADTNVYCPNSGYNGFRVNSTTMGVVEYKSFPRTHKILAIRFYQPLEKDLAYLGTLYGAQEMSFDDVSIEGNLYDKNLGQSIIFTKNVKNKTLNYSIYQLDNTVSTLPTKDTCMGVALNDGADGAEIEVIV